MAIFFPPPPPFMGGHQPHEPARLPPTVTAVRVDNPPFGLPETVAVVATIIALAQPALSHYVFQGAGATQPYAPPRMAAALLNATNNPPFGSPEAISVMTEAVAAAQPDPWQYGNRLGPAGGTQPYAPRLLNPSITAVRVDNPPFDQRLVQSESEIVALTQPAIWPVVFVGGNQPYAPLRMAAGIPGVSVNNPPFTYGGPVAPRAVVVAIAQPDPWTFAFAGNLAPFLPRKLSPGIPGQSIDPPPFAHPERQGGLAETALTEAKTAWQPDPWVYAYAGGPLGAQPYGPRTLPPALTAVPVNNPPFRLGGPVALAAEIVALTQPPLWLYTFAGAAQPYTPKTLSPGLPGQSVDAPPVNTRAMVIIAEVVALNQPTAWPYSFAGAAQPYAPATLSPGIPGQSVDQPPFDLRRNATGIEVTALNQPEIWPYTFTGGRQPYGGEHTLPPDVEAVPVPIPGAGKRRDFPAYTPQAPWHTASAPPFQRKPAPKRATQSVEIVSAPPQPLATLPLPPAAGPAKRAAPVIRPGDALASYRPSDPFATGRAIAQAKDEQEVEDMLALLAALKLI